MAEERREENRNIPIDTIERPEDVAKDDISRLVEKEEELLESIPLPGYPTDEKERRKQWLSIPRRTRIAIRRMHEAFGYPVRSVLVNLLRAAKQPPEMINAARYFRSLTCEQCQDKPQTSKTAIPKPYVFNVTVGLHVFNLHDFGGNPYLFMNCICLGTTFQLVGLIREGHGSPTSSECLQLF